MSTVHLAAYILVMAGTTYLIRLLPLALFRREITSPFIRSFLFYIPYACLAAMTFPAILSSADTHAGSVAGFLTAVVLAVRKKSLLTVALAACAAVFIVERLITLL
ncbi:MAG: AzlD domain-containing protein [Lachnospiraceae bacterium]|nr:AzlD domain-containing protein [Lachnospiraceae bacterium]